MDTFFGLCSGGGSGGGPKNLQKFGIPIVNRYRNWYLGLKQDDFWVWMMSTTFSKATCVPNIQ